MRSILTLLTFALLFSSFSANATRLQIQNKGSDTLVNVAQAWAETYSKHNPEVSVAVSGGGSGTGIAAMINGVVDVANSSRKMKSKEIKLAKSRKQDPVEHIVGFDALAVYLHKNSPITNLTVEQLAKIFGREGTVHKWSELGFKVPGCPSDKIVVVSRQNNSGTYAYFKKAVLGRTKYRMGTLDMHGSKEVVDLVEKTPCAIGYSGLAYATDHVKKVCVAKSSTEKCVAPTIQSAVDHTYPIARPLFMYTNGQPKGHIKEYLEWIMSNKGQCIIKNKGYAPIKASPCGSVGA